MFAVPRPAPSRAWSANLSVEGTGWPVSETPAIQLVRRGLHPRFPRSWNATRATTPRMSRRLRVRAGIALSAALVAAGCSGGTHVTSQSSRSRSGSRPRSASAFTKLDDARVLTSVGIERSDLVADGAVKTIGDGDVVRGQVSLDLCNAHFPSEGRRRARHEVEAVVGGLETGVETEALLYDSDAGPVQAFAELRGARQQCPNAFLTSPVAGVPPLRTTFGPAPDGFWPRTAGIERLAFTATTTSPSGASLTQVLVYQRRGRLLVAIYVVEPEGPLVLRPAVGGVPGLTERVASRMAAAPADVVDEAAT